MEICLRGSDLFLTKVFSYSYFNTAKKFHKYCKQKLITYSYAVCIYVQVL